VRIREVAEENAVHDAEHCGVQSDAEGDGQDGREGKQGSASRCRA
jgi:hypothetical protein